MYKSVDNRNDAPVLIVELNRLFFELSSRNSSMKQFCQRSPSTIFQLGGELGDGSLVSGSEY
jgi:hypothetical protein